MELGIYEYYIGITCIIISLVSIIIGLTLVLKYFKHKKSVLFFSGIAWIFMSEPWWTGAISFILVFIGLEPLSIELYFIISVCFIPFALLMWLTTVTELLYKEKQKLILVIFLIEGIIFEIFAIYFLFANDELIIIRQGPIDVNYLSFVLIYLFSVMVIILITGLLFAKESLKSDNKEIRLKGKLIALAFISFIIGGILDGVLEFNIITLLICRSIVISSGFEFYFGLLLPEWLKKLFIKNYKVSKRNND